MNSTLTKENIAKTTSGKTSGKIIEYMIKNNNITIPELASIIGVSERTIERNIEKLRNEGKIEREGSAKGGFWKVLDK